MVEIQGARDGHSVVGSQDYFGGQPTYCSCSRNNNDFVQSVNDVVSRQDENRTAFIGEAENIPTDLSAPQATFSQSSPSQANGSSSAENSWLVGGIV